MRLCLRKCLGESWMILCRCGLPCAVRGWDPVTLSWHIIIYSYIAWSTVYAPGRAKAKCLTHSY